MNDLKDKIKAIIELETKLGHFSVLDTKESPVLIQQILSNYEEEGCIKRQDSDLPQEKKNGELIFVGAPTGAGKDYLVAKISSQNREKRYVELNMDIFRHVNGILQGHPDMKHIPGIDMTTRFFRTRFISICWNGYSWKNRQ